MNNRVIRSLTKDRMKGKMKKAMGITLIYFIVAFLEMFILKHVSIIGEAVASILYVPLAFGWMKQLIELENGQNVGWVDFLSHGFTNFGKVWATCIYIGFKTFAFFMLIIIAVILAYKNLLLSLAIILASVIGIIIMGCRYIMINYTIAYDNSNTSVKKLVKKSVNDAKGKRWKFICMGIYYFLNIFGVYIIEAFIASIMFTIMKSSLIMPLLFISFIIVSLYLSVLNIAALNEYYKINVLGISDGNINNLGYNPILNNYEYDSNQSNYGFEQTQINNNSAIDMNNKGQSKDYFDN